MPIAFTMSFDAGVSVIVPARGLKYRREAIPGTKCSRTTLKVNALL
jgi:hypothetical protein